MCLDKKYWFPKRAKENIPCIKCLEHGKSWYITPYTNTVVKNSIQEAGDSLHRILGILHPSSIGRGFVHSFKYIRDYIYLENFTFSSYYAFLCYIPKGTLYYEGDKDYASTKLVYVTKLTCTTRQHCIDDSIEKIKRIKGKDIKAKSLILL